jgi:hypothetical protein
MKLMAAVALGCGFIAAPMVLASSASASPGSCDGAGCIPYLQRGATQGDHCVANTRYNFALTASGATLACDAEGQWIPSPPLVGVRMFRAQCGQDKGVAQSPDGVPLSCIGGAWSDDYTIPFS